MVKIGYKLACEEHGPADLVRYARQAEEAGFDFAMISDHYHPWIEKEGHSPFVWAVLGGISEATSRIQVATGVTCPTVRIHPAIIAQAAATTTAMLPGRFALGVGSGEYLNEHILGDRWPPAPVRTLMLEEAVDIIRRLWEGGTLDYYGAYYTVENARIYTLPEVLPPIVIASEDQNSAASAGRIGDGLVNPGSNKEKVARIFKESGGEGKPCYIETSVCVSDDIDEAKRIAYEHWPLPAFKGETTRILPTPAHYEQLAQMVKPEEVAEKVVMGTDVREYVEKIGTLIRAGYDHICLHQVGPDQQGFFEFAKAELLPATREKREVPGMEELPLAR